MYNVFFVISICIYLYYVFWKFKRNTHILQLHSYYISRYLKWLKVNWNKAFYIQDLVPIISVIFFIFNKITIGFAIWSISYAIIILGRKNISEKKKLVFTNRVKRLLATTFLLYLIIFLCFGNNIGNSLKLGFYFLILLLLDVFSPLILSLVCLINSPIEILINKWYINDAKKILRRMPNTLVIGITGSYGKTSTKNYLCKILSVKYNVLMTPESYNTTLGVTKTIRTMLKPIHEILIVEMGAKIRGDIKEIFAIWLLQPSAY